MTDNEFPRPFSAPLIIQYAVKDPVPGRGKRIGEVWMNLAAKQSNSVAIVEVEFRPDAGVLTEDMVEAVARATREARRLAECILDGEPVKFIPPPNEEIPF